MDDNKGKVRLKSCREISKRNRGSLLKPDVMLVTKDVMVPLTLPPPPGKFFPTDHNRPKSKLKIQKTLKLNTQSLTLPEVLDQHSLSQVKKITSGKTLQREILPKSLSYCVPDHSKTEKNFYLDERETSSLEQKDPSLWMNSEVCDLKIGDNRDTDSVNVLQVEKLLTSSSRDSISSLSNSTETRSCSSSKSLEDSLPKLPFNMNSSSRSKSNNSTKDRSFTYEHSRTSTENIKSQNEVIDLTQSNVTKDLASDEIKSKFNSLNTSNIKSGINNVDKELTNFHQEVDFHTEKQTTDCNNKQDTIIKIKNDIYAKTIEENRIMIDVEYLLQSMLRKLENREDFNRIDNCERMLDVEKKPYPVFNEFGTNSILNERIPTMIEFRNLFAGIEKDEEQSAHNNSEVNVENNNEQIEIKYSWQMISLMDQDLNDIDSKEYESIINESNSKSTSTEDFNLNKPEFRYSWQKLTSKYLAKKDTGDGWANINHLVRNIKDISENSTNTENPRDYSPPRETRIKLKNFKEDEPSKGVENISGNAVNSPLNNIISSMLPEIRLINRHTSFNNTTPDILGSHTRNDANKSTASSVSSIKHVIANLTEMVTQQKQMLDAHIKNHESSENVNVLESLVNPVEKVEIFPSTLHVLGDYIVRDIRPIDDGNLLEFSNKTIQDRSLPDRSVTVHNRGLDRTFANVSNDKRQATIINPSKKSNNSISQSTVAKKDSNLSSMLSHPISFDNNYYSTIFEMNDKLLSIVKNPKKDKRGSCTSEKNRNSSLPVLGCDRKLIGRRLKPAVADMAEMIGISLDPAYRRDSVTGTLSCTKDTTELKPRMQVSFSETKDAGDAKTKKDKLTTRLEAAMNRLKQSEEQIDANWNLDYSVLDIEEGISEKIVKLPNQVEEHIKDIVKSAEEYLAKLEEQLNDLRNADNQIINSSERTFKDIDQTYQLLMDNLCQEINKRRNLVRLETEVLKHEGLAPLRACKQEVDAQIRSTQHLIVLTENMLTRPITFNKERLGKIITATSHMGRIPAVPMPEELPYVTFSLPNEEITKEIVDRISCLGCVLRMGPVQFTEICERPACLQLKWHIVDPEYTSEEQTFIVQKALGEISESNSTAFETVYSGLETSCFVREIPVDHKITLRVGIQVADSAWSVHRIAQTSIPAYSWDMNNSDYLITNSGRIATKVTQNSSTLLSRSAQFDANHIIEFKFLEAASGTDDEGIGLVFEPGGTNETLKRTGSLLITPNGNIFMNGEQKLMQLPKMELGTRIIFTSEKKDDETLRITIESTNKAVTYDWTISTPLHFAARFLEQNKWNLMVK